MSFFPLSYGVISLNIPQFSSKWKKPSAHSSLPQPLNHPSPLLEYYGIALRLHLGTPPSHPLPVLKSWNAATPFFTATRILEHSYIVSHRHWNLGTELYHSSRSLETWNTITPYFSTTGILKQLHHFSLQLES